MKVTCEINDYSNPVKPRIIVHSDWLDKNLVKLEVSGVKYTVNGKELITAINKCMLNISED